MFFSPMSSQYGLTLNVFFIYLLETKKLPCVKADTSQTFSGDNTNDGSEQLEKQLQVREENKEGNSEKQSTNRFVSVPLN